MHPKDLIETLVTKAKEIAETPVPLKTVVTVVVFTILIARTPKTIVVNKSAYNSNPFA